ncbi:MAG: hypothetical protein WCH21_10905 [Bacteroidota bacterium]
MGADIVFSLGLFSSIARAQINYMKCLICKKYFTRPLAHVWQAHKITSLAYCKRFGLDTKRGITTEADREHMRQLASEHSAIIKKNFENGAKYRFQKGQFNNYARTQQTITRLKEHWEKVSNKKGTPCRVEKITIMCAFPSCGKTKKIYPRYYKENNNYCSVICRNRQNNICKKNSKTQS